MAGVAEASGVTAGDDREVLTIEQLAARTGLSVRNIRSHVTRGLLPAPRLRGRTGYYGPEHVARLELVTALQQQGFNLAAVNRLLAGPVAPSAEQTVEFYRTALGAWLTEEPEVWATNDLAAAFGEQPDDARITRLVDAGLAERLDVQRVRVLNPSLLRIGVALMGLGFDVDALLDLVDVLVLHGRAVSDALVAMFLATHWQPYVDAGQPPERLPDLQAIIEALHPLASQAVVAVFQQAMTETVNRAFETLTGEPSPAAPDTA
jgi:DNA-binding transcriptional MerR regulator